MIVITRYRRQPYSVSDAVGSMGTGIIEQLALAFVNSVVAVTLYEVVYRAAIFRLDERSPWVWFATFVLVDFIYFGWHYLSHKTNFMWAGHVLHHQSEKFNF